MLQLLHLQTHAQSSPFEKGIREHRGASITNFALHYVRLLFHFFAPAGLLDGSQRSCTCRGE